MSTVVYVTADLLSVLMFAFALEYFCTSKVYNHLKAEETMYIQFCNAVSNEIQVNVNN